MHCYGSPEFLEVASAPDSLEILFIYRGLDPALEDVRQSQCVLWVKNAFIDLTHYLKNVSVCLSI